MMECFTPELVKALGDQAMRFGWPIILAVLIAWVLVNYFRSRKLV